MSEQIDQPADWQTLDEASSYVGTTKYVVSCLIRAGVLKFGVRKGRKYVSRKSLDKFACLGGPNAKWVKDIVRRFRPPRRQRSLKAEYEAHIKYLQDLGLMVRPSEKQTKIGDQ